MDIFDSEGNADISYLNSRISTHQSNPKFLNEFVDLFRDLDIHFTGPYFHKNRKGIWYHIQILKKTEILKFIKEFGSCHL